MVSPARRPGDLRKLHILVVDNDRVILNLVADILKYFGFNSVIKARDGFEAVQKMRQEEIDLIITDWELRPLTDERGLDLPPNTAVRSDIWSPSPPKNGACFVRYLRLSKYSPNPYIPIIMLTGLGLQNYIEYARDCGVNEILLKPLLVEALCEHIAAVIDSPRPFVTSKYYKGPCRRRSGLLASGQSERRKCDIRIFRHTG